jgi:hypothetical protein
MKEDERFERMSHNFVGALWVILILVFLMIIISTMSYFFGNS